MQYLNRKCMCCCSGIQSCPTLNRPKEHSMAGFLVFHHLLEVAQTHVHKVGDAIQLFCCLLSPSPPALNLSQHQGLFQWISSSHQVAKLLELHLQHPSFQWIFRIELIYDWLACHPCSPRDSQESSPIQFKSINSSALSLLYGRTLTTIMTTEKTIALMRQTTFGKVMSLFFNMLSRFVIAFLPSSKHLLISWLQSPSAVILQHKKIKSVTVSIVSPYICHEVSGPDTVIFLFWMLSFKPDISLTSFTFIKKLFSSSSFSAIRMVSSAYLRLLIFLPEILIPACASFSLAFHMMCYFKSFRIWNSSAGIPSLPLSTSFVSNNAS